LMEGYSYILLLLTMLLLILYWSDLLVAAKARITMIQRPNQVLFFFFFFLAVGGCSAILFVVIYKYEYWQTIKAASFGVLGVLAFVEAIFAIVYGSQIIRQLRTTSSAVTTRKSSLAVPPSSPVLSDNPMFQPSSSSTASPAPPRRGSRLSLGSLTGGSSQKLDDMEAKAQRQAMKRAAPMTRLLLVTAVCLFCEVCVAMVAALSWVMSVPITNFIIFMLDAFFEIVIYSLVLYTISPIWQEQRRRRRRSSGGLAVVDEDEAERAKRNYCARVWRCMCCCLSPCGFDEL